MPRSDVLVYASNLAKFARYNTFCSVEECESTFWQTNRKLAAELGRSVPEQAQSHIEAAVELCSPPERASLAVRLSCSEADLPSAVTDIASRAARAETSEASASSIAGAIVAGARKSTEEGICEAKKARQVADAACESSNAIAAKAAADVRTAESARSAAMQVAAEARQRELVASAALAEREHAPGDAAVLRAEASETAARRAEKEAAVAAQLCENVATTALASARRAAEMRDAACAAAAERERAALSASEDLAVAEKVASAAEREARMQRGTLRESSNLDGLARERGESVNDRNNRAYSRRVGTTPDGRKVILVGRIDGKVENGHVVEVKERRNRLFNRVVAYEKVQVMAYMHLLGEKEAVLRERYDDQTREYVIKFDDAFWAEVMRRLHAFVDDQLRDCVD